MTSETPILTMGVLLLTGDSGLRQDKAVVSASVEFVCLSDLKTRSRIFQQEKDEKAVFNASALFTLPHRW